MTRSKKAAKKAAPPVIDPYLPANGNFGYRVSRYELDLEYKVAINRLSGSATITAVTLAALRTFTLDLSDALTVSKVSVNGQAPGPVPVVGRQAAHRAAGGAARRGGDDDRGALRRHPPTDPLLLGRSRFRGADRRRRWSPANPTAPRRGFPATTIRARRPASGSGSAPKARTTRSPTASCCPRRARAGMTTWTYEQAEPTSTYLVTLQIGMYNTGIGMAKTPVSDARGAAGPVAAQLRTRLRPPAADDEAVRQAVRPLPAVDAATPWW